MNLSTPYRTALYFTFILVAVGCFLPWGCYGDFVYTCERGLEFQTPEFGKFFTDRGGIAILLFSALAIASLTKRHEWNLAHIWPAMCAVVPVLVAAGNIVYWLARHAAEAGRIGSAQINIGLPITLAGGLTLMGLVLARLRAREN